MREARPMAQADQFPPGSFAGRLCSDLDRIETDYTSLITRSAIRNVDPNRYDSSIIFVGAAQWGWCDDDSLIADRTLLLERLDEWIALFELLHRNALPATRKRISSATKQLRKWMTRARSDSSIPPTIDQALERVRAEFGELRALTALAVSGDDVTLAVPDTNALLREPDIAAQARCVTAGPCTVVLMTAVMSELDEQKDRGRTPDVRERATKAVRRIKGLRDRGDLRTGVPVEGAVALRAEHREVRAREVLEWLDPEVPDDRLLAAALDLQARQPAATVVLVTADINLQTKASVVGVPFAEPPA